MFCFLHVHLFQEVAVNLIYAAVCDCNKGALFILQSLTHSAGHPLDCALSFGIAGGVSHLICRKQHFH